MHDTAKFTERLDAIKLQEKGQWRF